MSIFAYTTVCIIECADSATELPLVLSDDARCGAVEHLGFDYSRSVKVKADDCATVQLAQVNDQLETNVQGAYS